jgi:protein-histidine pros-kinase
MTLLVRVNLILGALTLMIALVCVTLGKSAIESQARDQLLAEAGLMLDSAVAIRTYTADEIGPLLDARLKDEFLPQTVPFYAATQNFLKLHEKYPNFGYKEATLNPTNPRDRAADWEQDLIQRFRNDASVRELSGLRETPMGQSLYLARPIHVEQACLTCHSMPSVAPAALVTRYGSNNGFGWQANEIIGAQVVSVPFASAADSLSKLFNTFLLLTVGSLGVVWAMVNIVLYFQLVEPLRQVSRIADTLSLGQPSVEEFPTKGAQEITALGASFNRMRKSLAKAMTLLGGT